MEYILSLFNDFVPVAGVTLLGKERDHLKVLSRYPSGRSEETTKVSLRIAGN
jgi:hypothetical protein